MLYLDGGWQSLVRALAERAARRGALLTVGARVEQLERAFYEQALDLAPDEDTRDLMLDAVPRHLHLESSQPLLIAPEIHRSRIVVTVEAEEDDELLVPWWRTTQFDTEALALEEVPESPEE